MSSAWILVDSVPGHPYYELLGGAAGALDGLFLIVFLLLRVVTVNVTAYSYLKQECQGSQPELMNSINLNAFGYQQTGFPCCHFALSNTGRRHMGLSGMSRLISLFEETTALGFVYGWFMTVELSTVG